MVFSSSSTHSPSLFSQLVIHRLGVIVPLFSFLFFFLLLLLPTACVRLKSGAIHVQFTLCESLVLSVSCSHALPSFFRIHRTVMGGTMFSTASSSVNHSHFCLFLRPLYFDLERHLSFCGGNRDNEASSLLCRDNETP